MQNSNSGSSRPLTSLPSQLHTPTQSFSDAAFTPESTMDVKLTAWNEQKAKDDLELAKARLADQRFNISKCLLI